MREALGLSPEEFLGLGRIDPNDHQADFCMTVLALRLSGRANGVSRLHGQVSRRMWNGMWPDFEASEVPILSITNGVHAQTWTSLGMAELLINTSVHPGARTRRMLERGKMYTP